MALIKCPECSAKISDKASRCPKCGAPILVRKWRCSKCGNIISKEPCPYCSNVQAVANANTVDYKSSVETPPVSQKRKAPILIVFLVVIITLAIVIIIQNIGKETGTNDMGAIGNKITVDGTVAYVARENEILVPYDFYGDFNICDREASGKSLKGCENPRLPTDETNDLPEEVVREIISFYGEAGGFWTSVEVDHANIEIAGVESESLHYAGIMDNYFSVGNDGVADAVWGYCLDATSDTTTMGLLVLYNVIVDEFEFTDVEDTADPNYSTEPIFESADEENQNNNDSPSEADVNGGEKKEPPASEMSGLGNTAANISAGGFAAIQDDWIYYASNTGLYRIKTDNSDQQQLSEESFIDIVLGINVTGEWLLYRHPNNFRLYRMKTDGTNNEPLTDDRIGSFLVKNDWIYSKDANCVYRMRIDGKGEKQIIARDPLCIEGGIQIVGDWIYYVNGESSLWRVKIDGSQSQKLTQMPSYVIFQVVGDQIYYVQDRTLFQMGIDGSDRREINGNITLSDFQVFQVIDDKIYYVDEGSLFSMQIDGSGNQKIVDSSVLQFNIVGDWIYYQSNEYNGKGVSDLYRIKTDGSCNELVG